MPTIGISLLTGKDRFAPGERIAAELSIFNRSGRPAVLHFPTAQRYDFAVEDKHGTQVWQWSDGRSFAQMLGSESIGPGREVITFAESIAAPTEPGRYRLVGRLAPTELKLSAAVWVVVE